MLSSWKMIYLARRNPVLAPAAFAQAWREHSALGRQCRNVQEKVLDVAQCSRLLDLDLDGTSADYDGVGRLRLRDAEAVDEIWSDRETLAIMRPDEPRVFSTYVRDFTLVCREHVLRGSSQGKAVLYGFLRCYHGGSREELNTAWLDARGWIVDEAFGQVRGVVYNAVVREPPPGYPFDGIAEWWFDTPEALRSAFSVDGVPARLPAACGELIDLPGSIFLATQVTHRRP